MQKGTFPMTDAQLEQFEKETWNNAINSAIEVVEGHDNKQAISTLLRN